MAKLIYLMGASGSGKDTLLNYLKEYSTEDLIQKQKKNKKRPGTTNEFKQNNQRIIVAHRYITRHFENSNENHIFLCENDFQFRLENSFFVMAWKANNLKYAVGREVYDWVKQGHDVIVNGSRAYLPDAQKIFGKSLVAVCLNVPEDILVERLLLRGRESQKEIEQRIIRARTYSNGLPPYTHFIDNDCDVNTLAIQLYTLLNMIDSKAEHQYLTEALKD